MASEDPLASPILFSNQTGILGTIKNVIRQDQLRMSLCSALLALGAFGNLRSVRQVWTRRKTVESAIWRKSALRLSLLAADCMIIFIFLTSELAWIHLEEWYAGDVACRIIMTLRPVGFIAMSGSIVAIAFDRMLYAKSAVWYHMWQKRIIITAPALWVVAVLVAAPNFVFYGLVKTDCSCKNPTAKILIPTIHLLFMFWIPLVGILFAYGTICHLVSSSFIAVDGSGSCEGHLLTTNGTVAYAGGAWFDSGGGSARMNSPNGRKHTKVALTRNTRRQRANCCKRLLLLCQRRRTAFTRRQDAAFSRKRMIAQAKALRLASGVVIPYILCWTPFQTQLIWMLFDEADYNAKAGTFYLQTSLLLAVANACINPFIYAPLER